ncbi:hypothetical protein [Kitasatospora sp. NPDC001683]
MPSSNYEWPLPHEVEKWQWPDGLPEHTDGVFRAYGDGSHVAVTRYISTMPDQVVDIWAECLTCGAARALERLYHLTQEGRDRFIPALADARRFASDHVEQTRG